MKLGTLAVLSAAIVSGAAAVTIVALQGAAQQAAPPAGRSTTVRYPLADIGVSSLAARATAQRDTAGQFKVDYDFQFADRVAESGITFVHPSWKTPRSTTSRSTTTTEPASPRPTWTATA